MIMEKLMEWKRVGGNENTRKDLTSVLLRPPEDSNDLTSPKSGGGGVQIGMYYT
jgi:hypothetical protein